MSNELKEIDIKNCTHYFDGIININSLDIDNILLDQKPCENILIYHTRYKTTLNIHKVVIVSKSAFNENYYY